MLDDVLKVLNSSFFPTVVVALTATSLTYRQTRAGQRDTRDMAEKANTVLETQNAMLAYKDLYETERARRIEAENDLAICRGMVRENFENALRTIDRQPSRRPSGQRKEKE